MSAPPKLTPAQVATIRARYAAPMHPTLTALGEEYGVSAMGISKVVRGLTHKTVGGSAGTLSSELNKDRSGRHGSEVG